MSTSFTGSAQRCKEIIEIVGSLNPQEILKLRPAATVKHVSSVYKLYEELNAQFVATKIDDEIEAIRKTLDDKLKGIREDESVKEDDKKKIAQENLDAANKDVRAILDRAITLTVSSKEHFEILKDLFGNGDIELKDAVGMLKYTSTKAAAECYDIISSAVETDK